MLVYLESLAQVYSNPIANALELLQSSTKLCVGKRDSNCGLFLCDIFNSENIQFCTGYSEFPYNMMTSSDAIFSASLALCVGNSPVTGKFLTQRPGTRSFDVFYLRLNKR